MPKNSRLDPYTGIDVRDIPCEFLSDGKVDPEKLAKKLGSGAIFHPASRAALAGLSEKYYTQVQSFFKVDNYRGLIYTFPGSHQADLARYTSLKRERHRRKDWESHLIRWSLETNPTSGHTHGPS